MSAVSGAEQKEEAVGGEYRLKNGKNCHVGRWRQSLSSKVILHIQCMHKNIVFPTS